MKYTTHSEKSVEEVSLSIQEAVKQFKFGVLHIHNIKETLIKKGKDFKKECLVLDVCNPNYAKEILDQDMEISMMLPCKISIYQDENTTKISILKISELIPLLNKDLKQKALEIEKILLEIISLSK